MKKILAAAALVAFSAVSATAADMAPRTYTKAPPMMEPIYNWTGFYIGANGGYGFGRSRYDFVGAGTTTGRFDIDGGIVGGTAGYNWQSGAFVFGIEGDGAVTDIRGSATCPGVVFTCRTTLESLGTIRGRVGYATNNVLFYVTGGGAIGEVKARDFVTATGATFGQVSDTRTGYVAGGGIEYGFSPNWSAKVEYQYVDLGRLSDSSSVLNPINPTRVRFEASTVRAGINYRFGGPVVARY